MGEANAAGAASVPLGNSLLDQAREILQSLQDEEQIILNQRMAEQEWASQSTQILDFLPKLISSFPAARVIVLTSSTETEAHQRAVQSGAMGLVLKEQGAEVLIAAIEKVYSGEVWLARSLTASVLSGVSRSSPNNEEALKIESLTKREREIIALTAQGFKRSQIAEKLFISDSTVRNHLTSILSKLELSDRFELVFYAYRHGLSKPPV